MFNRPRKISIDRENFFKPKKNGFIGGNPGFSIENNRLLEPLFKILNNPVCKGHRSTLKLNMVVQVEQYRANQLAIF